jgi:3-dehydroquinate synthase
MPKSFDIEASSGRYPIIVGVDLLKGVIADNPNAIYIIDQILDGRVSGGAKKRILVEAVENHKSLEFMPEVIDRIQKLGGDRGSTIVAVGGGIIQDITTFVASIYMRGIPWTYVPTTVLSMVDSCIGGKSSVNSSGYKNVVGNFYPPLQVLVDPSFVTTLDSEMIIGGLFEAAKICYARNADEFSAYLAKGPGYPLDAARAEAIIVQSLFAKKWFIETDEFDKNERLLLNYGHTFGHALEAASDFGISHGIGVGLGMLIAIEYAVNAKRLNVAGLRRVAGLKAHIKEMLGPGASCVPRSLAPLDLDLVIRKFDYDKKHRRDHYRIVIPTGGGELEQISLVRSDETRRQIVLACKSGLGEVPLKATFAGESVSLA